MLELVGHPSTGAPGATLSVAIAQQAATDTPSYAIAFETGLAVLGGPSASPGFPLIGASGYLVSGGVSGLSLQV